MHLRQRVLAVFLVGWLLVSGIPTPSRSAPGTTKPQLPTPLAIPEQPPPIEPASSDGYLPASWDVTPTGQFTYIIPLQVPDGRAGMQPSLSLGYSSGAGNGILGVGWSVSGASSITRCGKTLDTDGVTGGVDFSATDRFCWDGQKLVAISGVYGASGTEYRTEADSFAKIVSTSTSATDPDPLGPQQFVVYTKSSRTLTYDALPATRIAARLDGTVEQTQPVRVLWRLTSEADRAGNTITYEYDTFLTAGGTVAQWGVESRLRRIRYTGSTDGSMVPQRYVEFVYDTTSCHGQLDPVTSTCARPDPIAYWQSGVHWQSTSLLERIEMYAPNPISTALVWQYKFYYKKSNYNQTKGGQRMLLQSVQQCNSTGGCDWDKHFTYSPAQATASIPQFELPQSIAPAVLNLTPIVGPVLNKKSYMQDPSLHILDLNGDGAADLLYSLGTEVEIPVNGRGNYLGYSAHFALLSTYNAAGVLEPLKEKHTVPANDPSVNASYGQVNLPASYPIDLDGDGQDELWAVVQDADNCRVVAERWTGQGFVRTGQERSCTDDVYHFQYRGPIPPQRWPHTVARPGCLQCRKSAGPRAVPVRGCEW